VFLCCEHFFPLLLWQKLRGGSCFLFPFQTSLLVWAPGCRLSHTPVLCDKFRLLFGFASFYAPRFPQRACLLDVLWSPLRLAGSLTNPAPRAVWSFRDDALSPTFSCSPPRIPPAHLSITSLTFFFSEAASPRPLCSPSSPVQLFPKDKTRIVGTGFSPLFTASFHFPPVHVLVVLGVGPPNLPQSFRLLSPSFALAFLDFLTVSVRVCLCSAIYFFELCVCDS